MVLRVEKQRHVRHGITDRKRLDVGGQWIRPVRSERQWPLGGKSERIHRFGDFLPNGRMKPIRIPAGRGKRIDDQQVDALFD